MESRGVLFFDLDLINNQLQYERYPLLYRISLNLNLHVPNDTLVVRRRDRVVTMMINDV